MTMTEREIALTCKICKKDIKLSVEKGYLILIEEGVGGRTPSVELVKERPGRQDVPVRDIFCPECGCMGGLNFTNQ